MLNEQVSVLVNFKGRLGGPDMVCDAPPNSHSFYLNELLEGC